MGRAPLAASPPRRCHRYLQRNSSPRLLGRGVAWEQEHTHVSLLIPQSMRSDAHTLQCLPRTSYQPFARRPPPLPPTGTRSSSPNVSLKKKRKYKEGPHHVLGIERSTISKHVKLQGWALLGTCSRRRRVGVYLVLVPFHDNTTLVLEYSSTLE